MLLDIALLRGADAEALPGVTVQCIGDALAVALRQVLHRTALRDVLPEESVHILVTPTLPRVVRRREGALRLHEGFEPLVRVELRSVVGRHFRWRRNRPQAYRAHPVSLSEIAEPLLYRLPAPV